MPLIERHIIFPFPQPTITTKPYEDWYTVLEYLHDAQKKPEKILSTLSKNLLALQALKEKKGFDSEAFTFFQNTVATLEKSYSEEKLKELIKEAKIRTVISLLESAKASPDPLPELTKMRDKLVDLSWPPGASKEEKESRQEVTYIYGEPLDTLCLCIVLLPKAEDKQAYLSKEIAGLKALLPPEEKRAEFIEIAPEESIKKDQAEFDSRLANLTEVPSDESYEQLKKLAHEDEERIKKLDEKIDALKAEALISEINSLITQEKYTEANKKIDELCAIPGYEEVADELTKKAEEEAAKKAEKAELEKLIGAISPSTSDKEIDNITNRLNAYLTKYGPDRELSDALKNNVFERIKAMEAKKTAEEEAAKKAAEEAAKKAAEEAAKKADEEAAKKAAEEAAKKAAEEAAKKADEEAAKKEAQKKAAESQISLAQTGIAAAFSAIKGYEDKGYDMTDARSIYNEADSLLRKALDSSGDGEYGEAYDYASSAASKAREAAAIGKDQAEFDSKLASLTEVPSGESIAELKKLAHGDIERVLNLNNKIKALEAQKKAEEEAKKKAAEEEAAKKAEEEAGKAVAVTEEIAKWSSDPSLNLAYNLLTNKYEEVKKQCEKNGIPENEFEKILLEFIKWLNSNKSELDKYCKPRIEKGEEPALVFAGFVAEYYFVLR